MYALPNEKHRLTEEAIYLGILTARGVKPLSRLEYPVEPQVWAIWEILGLRTAQVTRRAQNGAPVVHTLLSREWGLLRSYEADFAGTTIQGETPAVVRAEARHFGYPACCAEAYLRAPYGPNGLDDGDQALLFHRACPGCPETPRLIPLYRAAFTATRALLAWLEWHRGNGEIPA